MCILAYRIQIYTGFIAWKTPLIPVVYPLFIDPRLFTSLCYWLFLTSCVNPSITHNSSNGISFLRPLSGFNPKAYLMTMVNHYTSSSVNFSSYSRSNLLFYLTCHMCFIVPTPATPSDILISLSPAIKCQKNRKRRQWRDCTEINRVADMKSTCDRAVRLWYLRGVKDSLSLLALWDFTWSFAYFFSLSPLRFSFFFAAFLIYWPLAAKFYSHKYVFRPRKRLAKGRSPVSEWLQHTHDF